MKRILKNIAMNWGLWAVFLLTILKMGGCAQYSWGFVLLPIWGPAAIVLLFYILAKIFNKKG